MQIPTLYANLNCSSDTRELHFPLVFKNMMKAQTSCKDALKVLESEMVRKPGKLSFETILEDILPYLPHILNRDYLDSERNLILESYLIFREIGFELINGTIEPAPLKIYNYIKGNIISPETLISFKHFHEGVNLTTASFSSMAIDTTGYDAFNSSRKRKRLRSALHIPRGPHKRSKAKSPRIGVFIISKTVN